MATIAHGDTKNGNTLGTPLNDIAMDVLRRPVGKHETHVWSEVGIDGAALCAPLGEASAALSRPADF